MLEANGGDQGPTIEMMQAIERRVPTVATIVAEHIARLPSVTPRTRADYRRDAEKHIAPHIGHVPVTALSKARVAD